VKFDFLFFQQTQLFNFFSNRENFHDSALFFFSFVPFRNKVK